MTLARCPAWALADGMPPPHDGEGFVEYWTRIGIDADVIAACASGLMPGAEDIANDRMAQHLRSELPGAFERYADAIAARFRPSRPARKIDPTTATKGER